MDAKMYSKMPTKFFFGSSDCLLAELVSKWVLCEANLLDYICIEMGTVFSMKTNNITDSYSTKIFQEAFMEVDENDCNYVVF